MKAHQSRPVSNSNKNEKEENVNTLFVLFVAELFAVAAMWHDKSPRSETERDGETPDPSVLFSRIHQRNDARRPKFTRRNESG